MKLSWKYLAVLTVTCTMILIDQLLKIIIIKKIPDQGIFLFNNDIVSFQLFFSQNHNLAFGLPLPQILILALSALTLLVLTYIIIKTTQKSFYLSTLFAFILGSGVSNFFDRIYYGYVVDFISLSFFNFNWPNFNFADGVISISCLILIYITLTNSKIYEK